MTPKHRAVQQDAVVGGVFPLLQNTPFTGFGQPHDPPTHPFDALHGGCPTTKRPNTAKPFAIIKKYRV